ncbi:MAG: response regulator, partial [Elusimicrobia bacterium]|nr:response regulator [Elusimicrobiota bacterium]
MPDAPAPVPIPGEPVPVPGEPAPEPARAPAHAPAPAPAAAAPAGTGKRLLVVDHHAEFARQLKGMFESKGCKVEVRADAVSGGAGVGTFKPDAAVIDLDLPAGGGKIVYRALRTQDASRDVPVIVLAP